jgi:hypothetical protein
VKLKIRLFSLAFLIPILLVQCTQKEDTPVLTGDYLGENSPGDTPQLFAAGVVSTGMYERDFAITGDGKEIYYGLAWGSVVTIMTIHQGKDRWSEPEVASFARDFNYFHFEPSITQDGKRIFFLCTRPREGQEPKPGWTHQNIWAADRNVDGTWGEPYDLGPPVNSEDNEYFPSVTGDRTLYFTHSKKADNKPVLFRSRFIDGKYTEPEKLPDEVNETGDCYNACIAPDESYLIACVNAREDSVTPGMANYYVFFRSEEDVWSEGINLGEKINPKGLGALSPAVSPDGKYFFFALTKSDSLDFKQGEKVTLSQIQKIYASPQNGSSDIYWVGTEVIEALRPGRGK